MSVVDQRPCWEMPSAAQSRMEMPEGEGQEDSAGIHARVCVPDGARAPLPTEHLLRAVPRQELGCKGAQACWPQLTCYLESRRVGGGAVSRRVRLFELELQKCVAQRGLVLDREGRLQASRGG